MNIDQFKDLLDYSEPSFGYNGKEYAISSPNGKFYVWAEDRPQDIDLEFESKDDLLDNWNIQGKTLREIIELIDL
ncbi:hypothetical protein [Anaerotignum sp.]|uniref:hypothetical protein n=1 Tax=Anaerotignum sp. TaxID=2039241 RepID=UPI0028A0D12D|nr:hypothetical protein [Anaerotignum sp.]